LEAVITLLPGDGIGPEVTAAAVTVLDAVASKFEHNFHLEKQLIGGAAIDATGDPLPEATANSCQNADAVFLGAVGGPKWSAPNRTVRPEQGLLGLRALLEVYANIRPVKVYSELVGTSPLRPEILDGVDMIVVRELTGGIYFGEKTRTETAASDLCTYTVAEVERIVRVAARMAATRSNKLCSVDKANVLETSRLWRNVTDRLVPAEFPEIELETILVDAAAMHLLSRPSDFDVIVTENMFGDILTDEASMLAGSLGLLPSASLGDGKAGLYEPIHGSAPDIAGQGIANPCASIASIALMLRHSLELEAEAAAVEAAIAAAIRAGARTADIVSSGEAPISTNEMCDEIVLHLKGL